MDRLLCFIGFHKWRYWKCEPVESKNEFGAVIVYDGRAKDYDVDRSCTICNKRQKEIVYEDITEDEYSSNIYSK